MQVCYLLFIPNVGIIVTQRGNVSYPTWEHLLDNYATIARKLTRNISLTKQQKSVQDNVFLTKLDFLVKT